LPLSFASSHDFRDVVATLSTQENFQRDHCAKLREISVHLALLRLSIRGMNFNKNIGMLLLAVYLIVVGVVGLTGIGAGLLLPILAIVAGIFILIGK
jgi:hypothetical protein